METYDSKLTFRRICQEVVKSKQPTGFIDIDSQYKPFRDALLSEILPPTLDPPYRQS